MNNQVENLVLEHLKRFQSGQERIEATLRELIDRTARLESGVASLHGDFASISLRLDRLNSRADRVESRLELVDTNQP